MNIFEINKEGWEQLKAFIKSLKNKENYCIQVISKDKKRSLEQNNWYWGYVVEAIRYFSKDEFRDYTADALHKHIKLTLSSLVSEYEGLLYEKRFKDGTIEIATDLSTNFQSMSQKEYNTYLNYLLEYIGVYINFEVGDLNELVYKFCYQTGKEYKPKP